MHNMIHRYRKRRTFYIFFIVLLCATALWIIRRQGDKLFIVKLWKISARDIHNWWENDWIDFSYFNNVTGTYNYIVPNVIHYVKFEKYELTFVEAVCILSAFKSQNPDRIFIHTDATPPTLEGKYFQEVVDIVGDEVLNIIHIKRPTHVFGQPLSSVEHSTDIARLRILAKYGGIYLDMDTFVVQSLDKFRHYEMSIGWPDGDFIGSQIIVAHRNARFLRLWLECYRGDYKPFMWYYNAGQKPTEVVLAYKPELVHRVRSTFGVQNLIPQLYLNFTLDWTKFYAIHLLIRHRSYLAQDDVQSSGIADFDETNIVGYNRTFGEMVRFVWDYYHPGAF